jgi:hypothetical protein
VFAQTEVGEFYMTVLVQQNVVGLEVPVDVVLLMD